MKMNQENEMEDYEDLDENDLLYMEEWANALLRGRYLLRPKNQKEPPNEAAKGLVWLKQSLPEKLNLRWCS